MDIMKREVLYHPHYGAMITGPGGFTEIAMIETQARAIAQVLDIPFVLRPVTNPVTA